MSPGADGRFATAADSFLRRLEEAYAVQGKPLPATVVSAVHAGGIDVDCCAESLISLVCLRLQGLCLSSQLVEQVPLSPHDRLLDVVVTPEEVIRVPRS